MCFILEYLSYFQSALAQTFAITALISAFISNISNIAKPYDIYYNEEVALVVYLLDLD